MTPFVSLSLEVSQLRASVTASGTLVRLKVMGNRTGLSRLCHVFGTMCILCNVKDGLETLSDLEFTGMTSFCYQSVMW